MIDNVSYKLKNLPGLFISSKSLTDFEEIKPPK